MFRELFEDLAGSLADEDELAVRASAVEEQADLTLPILDDADLDRALGAAAERIAQRHGLHFLKGKHHRREPLPQLIEEVPHSAADDADHWEAAGAWAHRPVQ